MEIVNAGASLAPPDSKGFSANLYGSSTKNQTLVSRTPCGILHAAVASVDAARLKNVGQLYRATGMNSDEADAQAFLFYCFIFGQSLLFLERGPRKRTQLIAKAAEKLVDDKSS
jgi:hypothetical protein